MKKIFVILAILFAKAIYAEEGIQFFHGTWKEALSKAKAENKLIFIDVYTSWCGPCKQMVRDIFPLKAVADKFNSSFVNYKIDAEKGEGIEVAKTYKVSAYPTYLFVNGDGVLYYTGLGSMSEGNFLKEASNALTEFTDPKPLPMWDAEYESKKNDRDFLIKYLQKRQKLRLKNDFIVDQYVTISSKEELLSKETLNTLLEQQGNPGIDGPFFKFLSENKTEIEKKMEIPAGFLNSILGNYAAGDLGRAVAKNDVQLMERIVAIRLAAPSNVPVAWEGEAIRISFYTQTGNEKELIKVLTRYGKDVVNYDKEKIKEVSARSLKNFEEQLASGQMKNMTLDQIELLRKFYSTKESVSYAYRIRSIAEAAFKVVNDKKVLNEAIGWLKLAAEYSDNFTIVEATAGIFHKLGKTQEAIKYQQEAITSFVNLKIDNEIIQKRLSSNLTKMKENKPTWIVKM